eukprot:147554_1
MACTLRKDKIKIIIMGPANVGKTSISNQCIYHIFSEQYKPTIGADYGCKQLQLDEDCTVNMSLWDTAGQERFQALVSLFYRGADAVVFVYDITNKQTFIDVDLWREMFTEQSLTPQQNRVPFMLLGNKCEIETKYYGDRENASILLVFGYCKAIELARTMGVPQDIMSLCEAYHGKLACAVSTNEGKEYANKHNMIFYEVSALNGMNIDKAFREITERALTVRGNVHVPYIPIPDLNVDNVTDQRIFACC